MNVKCEDIKVEKVSCDYFNSSRSFYLNVQNIFQPEYLKHLNSTLKFLLRKEQSAQVSDTTKV